ncbi:MAG: NUDIX domain-containing protein [Succinivibrionaceae bacterium]|nr:NUDIX domain-containing protein [Succinivibrionaceae bacterium]
MDSENQDFSPRLFRDDVTVHARRRLIQSRFALDQYELSYKRFDGSVTPVLKREIFERDQNAVSVLPYDPRTDEVVLIEQFRPGALNDPVSPWLIEVVAGMIDSGEKPLDAVIRELAEESGIVLGPSDLRYICAIYPSPGGCSERLSMFIASVDTDHLARHGGLEAESEDIRIFKSSASDAFAACDSGRICNCAAMVSLQYLRIHHQELRESFLSNLPTGS